MKKGSRKILGFVLFIGLVILSNIFLKNITVIKAGIGDSGVDALLLVILPSMVWSIYLMMFEDKDVLKAAIFVTIAAAIGIIEILLL